MPLLRVQAPGLAVAVYPLSEARITIGRKPDNTIQIEDRTVSAHHAELVLEEGHYRLHDLQSTNLTFLDDTPVTDFHLRVPCRILFGSVECEFDPFSDGDPAAPRLTEAQWEQDLAFLRAENLELLHRNGVLQRRLEMLASARLVTGHPDEGGRPEARRTLAERDELRFQTSGLKLELERVQEELAVTARERDQARQAYELLQAGGDDAPAKPRPVDKDSTQRLFVYPALVRRGGEAARPSSAVG